MTAQRSWLLLGRPRRPYSALIAAFLNHHRALVQEPLQAPAVVGLGGVDIPARIGLNAVNGIELSRLLPARTEAREDFQRGAIDDPYFFVVAVGQINVLLLWILRKRDIPGRAVTECLRRHLNFFNE